MNDLDLPDLPRPRFKTLIVAASPTHAEQLQRQYYDHEYTKETECLTFRHGSPKIYVTFPGEPLVGRQFKGLKINSRVKESILRGKYRDWYLDITLTRLRPGTQEEVTL